MNIILASSSPRRKELLAQLGVEFEIRPPGDGHAGYRESTPERLSFSVINDWEKQEARKIAESNALLKARGAAGRASENELIIGADTIVIFRNEILGKPEDRSKARLCLAKLSGKRHHVITGLAALNGFTKKEATASEVTEVRFRKLDECEIDAYLESGEPMDKAGAYGIQGLGALLVREIRGCYFNVVGLPLVRLSELLKELGAPLCGM